MKPDPENLCRDCNGSGQTQATATEVRRVGDKIVTVAQGSGCPNCLGTGVTDMTDAALRLALAAVRPGLI